jgi:hypothetical protein
MGRASIIRSGSLLKEDHLLVFVSKIKYLSQFTFVVLKFCYCFQGVVCIFGTLVRRMFVVYILVSKFSLHWKIRVLVIRMGCC